MNDDTPSDPTSEDGEPVSFTKAAKNLIKKHKPTILTVGALGLAAVFVAVRHTMEQSTARDAEDFGSVAGPGAVHEPHQPSVRHSVVGHKRTLADGRVISVSGYERGVAAA
ncbi:hypothetical protein [Streptomyces sp. Z26]|uniref:hypothetical protein n=1 Tax=Streptomyces sp. Z26 TaxID=2500177 RepID=UPI000EF13125|nr:hypothetical protein [Streptomyces sp. Z26]RLL69094.1 hypothetical protein D7M15_22255 [Streptomyces sp. Z26]